MFFSLFLAIYQMQLREKQANDARFKELATATQNIRELEQRVVSANNHASMVWLCLLRWSSITINFVFYFSKKHKLNAY